MVFAWFQLANSLSSSTDINSPGFRNLPSFFAETKYKNPTDGNNTNWQPTIGKNQTFFEWLGANPKIAQDFQNMLIGYNASKLPVTEFFPIAELVAGWETDKPLLVDVGGGHGADLKNIYDKFDELPPDSLILQDLPGPIEQANLPTPIKKMAHDIFQPQPVKGKTSLEKPSRKLVFNVRTRGTCLLLAHRVARFP